jgi:hypothetical protein
MAQSKLAIANRMERRPLPLKSANGHGRESLPGVVPFLSVDWNNGYWLAARAPLRTLVIHLPLLHNPDASGYQKPMEAAVLAQTLAEIKVLFPGHTAYRVHGWWHSSRPGGDSDQHLRLEIDARIGIRQKRLLRAWKEILKLRFHQDDIYMRLTERIEWI